MLVLLALFAACPSTETVATQGGSAARATLDRVKVTTDLAAIRTAIKLYEQTHEGERAPDLATLDVQGLHYPDSYAYDATAGTVSCPELGL